MNARKNNDNENYTLKEEYISQSGLKVRSYTKQMSENERKKSREQTTEEIVRILKRSGKL